ncbi:MAG: tRNA pseudouridine(55) synthase TruB [Proteobacteria bacterium]|nr:tRNA pseudouridine(55) synthase TruB [Pseudomonadota bacterium]
MIIPINKPAGITSHTVVNKLRKHYGIKKIGHAGTLDPFATGVLILLVGRESTKKSQELMKQDKIYRTKLKLGYISDTYDKDGVIQEYNIQKVPARAEIDKIIASFIGEISQIPPIYSAIKINGKKMYELARKGQTVDIPPRLVHIYDIIVLEYTYPYLTLDIACSSGTYIRSLGYDIGIKLGTGAYLETLERRQSGEYNIENCYSLDNLPELK